MIANWGMYKGAEAEDNPPVGETPGKSWRGKRKIHQIGIKTTKLNCMSSHISKKIPTPIQETMMHNNQQILIKMDLPELTQMCINLKGLPLAINMLSDSRKYLLEHIPVSFFRNIFCYQCFFNSFNLINIHGYKQLKLLFFIFILFIANIMRNNKQKEKNSSRKEKRKFKQKRKRNFFLQIVKQIFVLFLIEKIRGNHNPQKISCSRREIFLQMIETAYLPQIYFGNFWLYLVLSLAFLISFFTGFRVFIREEEAGPVNSPTRSTSNTWPNLADKTQHSQARLTRPNKRTWTNLNFPRKSTELIYKQKSALISSTCHQTARNSTFLISTLLNLPCNTLQTFGAFGEFSLIVSK
ncbi:hypothetical protein VP01_5245g1 [Puccinia sorghi]|uniref:Uncharacterized protein n=1 Tax=Puccinia sorghi TaxID=27349 RepID=A0A0L6ULA0_9BASI|nr:hypothetical protein VP01_5245g1 [Puccinia sorghi]